jgi:hypothetical protein
MWEGRSKPTPRDHRDGERKSGAPDFESTDFEFMDG